MYQLLILSCKLPQVFLALFIFTPVNSFKTHGKIGREGVYIFGVHMSGLQGCHAQEGCGSIQHASICPAMSCRHTTSPMVANMSYQEKKRGTGIKFWQSGAPLSAGRKHTVDKRGMYGQKNGWCRCWSGKNCHRAACSRAFTRELQSGNFMQSQRKRKVFPKGKAVDVNKNLQVRWACF